MSNESIRAKKERLNKLLKWVAAHRSGVTLYQIQEFLFDNYALSESSMTKYVKSLKNFRYLIAKGSKFFINPSKKTLL